tara:strand:- start:2566 stop:2802 length:237 start_codon:yes stop_codon:yes gene_type:complete
MGVFCPVCGETWLIYNSLCIDCKKIKHTLNLVGKERFFTAIDRLFILSDSKTIKILDKEEAKPGVLTRLQAFQNSMDK